eukprot:gene16409-16587_t
MSISPQADQGAEPVLSGAISIAGRIAASQGFKDLFRDGMALVERAALYLERDGRADSKNMPHALSLAYTAESMRLTTRLMHVASWLLYQRAVNEGEMTLDAVLEEKSKFRFDMQELCSTGAMFGQLPHEFQEICLYSLRLQQRIQHLDLLLSADTHVNAVAERPVNDLHRHLLKAFQANG